MRALAYFRTSDSADAADPAGLRALTRSFDTFCSSRGHTSLGVFSDAADAQGQPHYAEMVATIKESGLAYLIVTPSAAHLGGTLREQIERVLEMEDLSCQVVCDDPETTDPLQSAVRAWEGGAGSRRERIREGMRAKAARALGLGRPPYGYRLTIDGTLSPVEAEAEVVRTIFRLYLDEDLGVRSIARRLNDDGVRTRRGQAWSLVTVRDILRNHAYIGTYQRFGLRIPGSYEPIVDDAEFKRVQDRMTSRSPGRRHPRGEPFLLSGVLYCGHCGQRMMGVTRRQTWRRKDGERVQGEYRYYQCQSRINRNQCQYRTMRAEELEAQVIDRLRTSGGTSSSLGESGSEDTARDRTEAEARLRSLDRRFTETVQRAASSGASLSQLRIALRDVDAARAAVNERLRWLTDGHGQLGQALDAECEKLRDQWEGLEAASRQEILRRLVSRVTVTDGQVDVVLRS